MSIPARSVAALPDFRNQGIWLRVLLAANGILLGIALAVSSSPRHLPRVFAELAALAEPALLLTLATLYLLAPRLRRQPLWLGSAGVILLAAVIVAGIDALLAARFGTSPAWQSAPAGGLTAALLLYWLILRARAHAPALAEARLAALNARIRPHFLFNSLNAVLGILREEPRRAESALEELAELFRALMRENRALVPLSEEIALARKYLDIERLRLGERLRVKWEVETCPPDALAPPLLLQPLLENAVYHGIEPAGEPGEIRVHAAATRDGVMIEIDNPRPPTTDAPRAGNHMALDNLRERLMLFYDLEARLEVGSDAGRYRVRVELPLRRAG